MENEILKNNKDTKITPPKSGSASSNVYRKKINFLKGKIIFSGIVSFVFMAAVFGIYEYFGALREDNNSKIKQLTVVINDLNNSTSNLNTKIIEGRKYKEIWKTIDKKKKNFDGVKVSEINELFKKIAQQYDLFDPVITVSIPEVLSGGIYDRKSADVMFSVISIRFNAIDDTKAVLFIDDFLSNIPGYAIINNFSMNKLKSYDDKDLVNISTGNFGTSAIAAQIDISWYIFKTKSIKQPIK
jgi:cell division protein FtsL